MPSTLDHGCQPPHSQHYAHPQPRASELQQTLSLLLPVPISHQVHTAWIAWLVFMAARMAFEGSDGAANHWSGPHF
eukprot:2048763-Amphidinium_carterae.1